MPRTARAAFAGVCYHVINRGNRRATVFHDAEDYDRFICLMRRACARARVSVFAYCMMPNHFHLVIRPDEDKALSTWMHWLLSSHVRAHHKRYGTDGRIWTGRFKAFPIEHDFHLLTVIRYVERNALRAGLVDRAEHWQWGSLSMRQNAPAGALFQAPPVPLPANWLDMVNESQPEAELKTLRQSVNRGTPYGSRSWIADTATALGLESTLRPRGRPRRGGEIRQN